MANKVERDHCDGFYFDNVCPSRSAEVDSADIRYRAGKILHRRHLCLTFGFNPLDFFKACNHCPENKKLFRKEIRPHSQVRVVTRFQARDWGTGKVVKAFMRRDRMLKFANKNGLEAVEIANS